MVIERLKDLSDSDNPMAILVVDISKQLRLAGLGALSKIKKEGSKLLESLIEEGAAVEAGLKQAPGERPAPAAPTTPPVQRKPMSETDVKELEHIFEERVARALNQLEIPTRENFMELCGQLDALSKSLETLKQLEKS